MIRAIRMLMIGLTCAATGAQADFLSSKNDAFSGRAAVLDERAARAGSRSVALTPPKVLTPTKWGMLEGTRPREEASGPQGPFLGDPGRYGDMVRAAARRNGIPEDLFLRLVAQESRFDPQAVSHKGAIGLAQLMPGTADLLGVDPRDPAQNLDGGARYLRLMHERFGTWPLALAAYNAGPGAVETHGGVPPFDETRNYVRIVWGN